MRSCIGERGWIAQNSNPSSADLSSPIQERSRTAIKKRGRRRPRLKGFVREALGRFFLGLEKALEMAHAGGMAQLSQCLCLNLADTLARDIVHFADFSFQHIGILSLEFHVDKLSRPLL